MSTIEIDVRAELPEQKTIATYTPDELRQLADDNITLVISTNPPHIKWVMG